MRNAARTKASVRSRTFEGYSRFLNLFAQMQSTSSCSSSSGRFKRILQTIKQRFLPLLAGTRSECVCVTASVCSLRSPAVVVVPAITLAVVFVCWAAAHSRRQKRTKEKRAHVSLHPSPRWALGFVQTNYPDGGVVVVVDPCTVFVVILVVHKRAQTQSQTSTHTHNRQTCACVLHKIIH